MVSDVGATDAGVAAEDVLMIVLEVTNGDVFNCEDENDIMFVDWMEVMCMLDEEEVDLISELWNMTETLGVGKKYVDENNVSVKVGSEGMRNVLVSDHEDSVKLCELNEDRTKSVVATFSELDAVGALENVGVML